ncbi:MAG: aldehyde dehydrogenase family protein [Thermoflexus sp.]|jgi:acyl-CoA reductase-like NAD-dependent aldehyde dehydrogenase|nr:aldehyde dehydrogenase family protein [Thermoflexus sp.]
MRVRNYINGEWVEARSEEWYLDLNPATEEPVAEVVKSDERDVAAAVEAAEAAFEKWRKVPAPKRAEILYRAGQLLLERKEQMARLLTQEMGKILLEARGDVQEAIDMAFYIGGEGRRLLGYTAPVELPNKFGMAIRDPIGVVACITPWNFPIAIPSWKIFPALVAGNAVIFKPATDTPATAAEFVRIFEEAGLPPGVLNLVIGPGPTVGNALVEHPTVKAISFTGSTEVGRDLYVRAARHLKRVSLEMGGKNAIIVMEDANLELAMEATLWAAFGTTGQRCTACSRLILHRPIKEKFTEMLVERAKGLRLGNGLEPTTEVGPLINAAAVRKVQSYVEIGKGEGARLLCGGNPVKVNGKGFFYEPTIFDRVQPDMRIAQEEIFGPVLSIIETESLEEAICINNSVNYGLSSSLFTQDVNKAFQAIRDITTGIVYINHGTTGAEIQFPFGGTRGTGNGHREAGLMAIEFFTEWKAVYVDYSGQLQRAQIDTTAFGQVSVQ